MRFRPATRIADERHFLRLLIADVKHSAVACAIEPWPIAGPIALRELDSWSSAFECGSLQTASNGASVVVDRGLSTAPDANRLFVAFCKNDSQPSRQTGIDHLRRQLRQGTPLGAGFQNASAITGADFRMLVVETIATDRRAYFVQKKAIEAVCLELKVWQKVVRKVIRSGDTQFGFERRVQPQPKLGAWRGEL